MGVTAGVAKLVDAPDLGSGAYGVGVQVPPPAPQIPEIYVVLSTLLSMFPACVLHMRLKLCP